MSTSSPRIAIAGRSDRDARHAATPLNNRYHRIFEELAAVGLSAEPAVFDKEFAEGNDKLIGGVGSSVCEIYDQVI